MVVEPQFWKDKRVLVTGSTGFKGAWLCIWLDHVGAKVIGLGLQPNTTPSLYNTAGINEILQKNEILDIIDFERLSKFVQAVSPDIIFHLAAQPLVRRSYTEPLETVSTNVLGTANVLQACRNLDGLKAFVNVTSDKCYENHEFGMPFIEEDRMGGKDIYSASKGAAELITNAFVNSFFKETNIGIASGRAGNVIGGGDWSDDRLVPDYFRAVENAVPLVIRSPQSTRPWQHVLEPLSGYITLAQKLCIEGPDFNGGWNFGPSEKNNKSVQWVIDYLMTKNGGEVRYEELPQPEEAKLLSLNSNKASEKLNWRGRLTIEQALDLTIEWEQKRLKNVNMISVCREQISNYMKLTVS